MQRASRIVQRGSTQRYSEALPLLRLPGDLVIVVRGVPRSIVIQCPEGCGEVISLNLDRRAGPAWQRFERRGSLTIYPSVWRETGCEAHFIVWNNIILWCDRADKPEWNSGMSCMRRMVSLDCSLIHAEPLRDSTLDHVDRSGYG